MAILSHIHAFVFCVIAALITLSPATQVWAQRRDTQETTHTTWPITLEQAFTLENSTVQPGNYIATFDGKRLALAQASSMVHVGSMRLYRDKTTTPTNEHTPQIRVRVLEHDIEFIVEYQGKVFHGTAPQSITPNTPNANKISIDNKTNDATPAETDVAPSRETNDEDIYKAMSRYEASIAHCPERAVRMHWQTDDERFLNCVCPMLLKWKLPRLPKAKRFHRWYPNEKVGYSFTSGIYGNASGCRTWVGIQPPSDEKIDTFDPKRWINRKTISTKN